MATGKTHSRFVTVTTNGTAVTCSISSLNNVGLTTEQADITTLCNQIMEMIKGQQDFNIGLEGPFDNGPNGMHTIIQPLADGVAVAATVEIAIGIKAAPTTGDPEFQMTNVQLFDYLITPSTGNAVRSSASIRPGEGVTAQWGVV